MVAIPTECSIIPIPTPLVSMKGRGPSPLPLRLYQSRGPELENDYVGFRYVLGEIL